MSQTAGIIDKVVEILPEMTDQFNYRKQRNDLAIAQAQAQANQNMFSNKSLQASQMQKTILYVAIGALVLYLIFKFKK